MNSLELYPIPGSDEMPLTDIEVAVKENYHVSNQTGHNLVHVSYPLCTCAKRLSFVHLSVWLVKSFKLSTFTGLDSCSTKGLHANL